MSFSPLGTWKDGDSFLALSGLSFSVSTLRHCWRRNLSSFPPSDVIVKETDAQRLEGVSQSHLASS